MAGMPSNRAKDPIACDLPKRLSSPSQTLPAWESGELPQSARDTCSSPIPFRSILPVARPSSREVVLGRDILRRGFDGSFGAICGVGR